MEDIQSECYLILLHALEKYTPEAHRFVAYATNAINQLTQSEKELLVFNIFRHNTLKSYADWKNISRSTAAKKRLKLYNKLQQIIN